MHFDNASIHSGEVVQAHVTNFEVMRVKHPLESRSLGELYFVLFGTVEQHFPGHHCENLADVVAPLERFLGPLPEQLMQTVILEWMQRLQICWQNGREDVEPT
jgi:hypothetical protein